MIRGWRASSPSAARSSTTRLPRFASDTWTFGQRHAWMSAFETAIGRRSMRSSSSAYALGEIAARRPPQNTSRVSESKTFAPKLSLIVRTPVPPPCSNPAPILRRASFRGPDGAVIEIRFVRRSGGAYTRCQKGDIMRTTRNAARSALLFGGVLAFAASALAAGNGNKLVWRRIGGITVPSGIVGRHADGTPCDVGIDCVEGTPGSWMTTNGSAEVNLGTGKVEFS